MEIDWSQPIRALEGGTSILMMRLSTIFTALLLIFSLSFSVPLWAEPLAPNEKQKIEALITRVAEMNDASFIRNGRVYEANVAATFLRRKWHANEAKVKSARDFIDKIASFSGTSGKPYRIRYKNGSEIQSRDFLMGELSRIDQPSTIIRQPRPF